MSVFVWQAPTSAPLRNVICVLAGEPANTMAMRLHYCLYQADAYETDPSASHERG